MDSIYLDACSTTCLDPRVRAVLVESLEVGYANPASQHRDGQRAAARLESARRVLGDALAMRHDDSLILTSGGTEANNLAVFGLAGAKPFRAKPRFQVPGDDGQRPNIVVSGIEHPSVLEAVRAIAAPIEERPPGVAPGVARTGSSRYEDSAVERTASSLYELRELPVNTDGTVVVDALAELIDERTVLVALMLVNNETGVIQPVEAAARICAARNIPLHCDAVQAIGKIPVRFTDFSRAGVTTMSIAPHKFHGPRGIGALLMNGPATRLEPVLVGGFQQFGLRPGTEDVSLAVGFAEAVRLATSGLESNSRHVASLRDEFERRILAIPDAVINGASAARAPHCCNVSFPGEGSTPRVDRQALLMACDIAGVAVSTGSACASGSSEPSPVLVAMGLDRRLIDSAIRVSFSRDREADECTEAARRIVNAVKHLRGANSGGKGVLGPRGGGLKRLQSRGESVE